MKAIRNANPGSEYRRRIGVRKWATASTACACRVRHEHPYAYPRCADFSL